MDTNTNEPIPAAPVAAQETSSLVYAGFWIRVWAAIIDGVLVGIVIGLGAISSYHPVSQNFLPNGLGGLLGLVYFTLMESSPKQGTFGKMAVGIKVTDLAGNRISWQRALARYLSKIISSFIFFIGFIMVAFTEKKQGLHDIIAGTLVVKK